MDYRANTMALITSGFVCPFSPAAMKSSCQAPRRCATAYSCNPYGEPLLQL